MNHKLWCSLIYGVTMATGLKLTATPADENVGWAIATVNVASNAVNRAKESGNTTLIVKSQIDLAKADMNATQYAAAEKSYQQASGLNKTAFKNIKGNFKHALSQQVSIFSGLADSQVKQGKFEQAQQNYERGLHAAKLGIPASSPVVKHLRTGHIISIARRSTKITAESLFSQLLKSSERASGFVSGDIAMILENWIEYKAYSGKLADCGDMAKRLVDVSRRVYGNDHPEVARALARQASVIYAIYQTSGNKQELEKARPLIKNALKIRLSAFGPNHPITIKTKKELETLNKDLAP